jgi:hypothetical protein
MPGRERILSLVRLAAAGVLLLLACDPLDRGSPTEPSSSSGARDQTSASPSASASGAASVAPRDPCQAACDHHWLLEHRKERFCGYGPHRDEKIWDTKQCRQSIRDLENDKESVAACDCGPRFPPRSKQVEPEVDTPMCKATCDDAARLRYDMWEVCFRLPFQELYDDPKCRKFEAKFFALDRKQIDACRCHYVGNERAVEPDQCPEMFRQRFQNGQVAMKQLTALFRKSRSNATHYDAYLEWIDPCDLSDIKHLADGGFGFSLH